MLNERKAAILQAVVEGYISTSQPVGSGYVARAADLGVSSATVRNEMVALEQAGYISQPHTSAGRVPTEKGYRFFVDQLMDPYQLGTTEDLQIRSFFEQAHGELEQMLDDTSALLTQLTDYAAVVVGPDDTSLPIRFVQLVSLQDRLALVVAALANGSVRKHAVEHDAAGDEDAVAAASQHLHRHLVDTTLGSVSELPPTGRPAVDALCALALDALAADTEALPSPVFVGGASSVAAAFDAIETVQAVLTVLEKQLVVVSLVRDVLDRGLQVAIGTETGVEPLNECSLVVAPYEVQGERAGSIGVLGPTRMNYTQALAAVAVVSRRLGDALSQA